MLYYCILIWKERFIYVCMEFVRSVPNVCTYTMLYTSEWVEFYISGKASSCDNNLVFFFTCEQQMCGERTSTNVCVFALKCVRIPTNTAGKTLTQITSILQTISCWFTVANSDCLKWWHIHSHTHTHSANKQRKKKRKKN